jgi:hypothetical protein
MSVHVQTVTLTVFSVKPINPAILEDSIKDNIGRIGAVVDIDSRQTSELTDNDGQEELWERGFDPDVLDMSFDDDSDCLAAFQTYAREHATLTGV